MKKKENISARTQEDAFFFWLFLPANAIKATLGWDNPLCVPRSPLIVTVYRAGSWMAVQNMPCLEKWILLNATEKGWRSQKDWKRTKVLQGNKNQPHILPYIIVKWPLSEISPFSRKKSVDCAENIALSFTFPTSREIRLCSCATFCPGTHSAVCWNPPNQRKFGETSLFVSVPFTHRCWAFLHWWDCFPSFCPQMSPRSEKSYTKKRGPVSRLPGPALYVSWREFEPRTPASSPADRCSLLVCLSLVWPISRPARNVLIGGYLRPRGCRLRLSLRSCYCKSGGPGM